MKIRQIQTYHLLVLPILWVFLSSAFLTGCKDKKSVTDKVMVQKSTDINVTAKEIINTTFEDLVNGDNSLLKTLNLKHPSIVEYLYEQNSFEPVWTKNGLWRPEADTLLSFIDSSRYYGLFPEDYSKKRLDSLHENLQVDTSGNKNNLNASIWAETDILLTSAFIELVRDIKIGRLPIDTIDAKKDSSLNNSFYLAQLKGFKDSGYLALASLEPVHPAYQALKKALHGFLQKAKFKKYFFVNPKDTLHYKEMVARRLSEDSISLGSDFPDDSLALAQAIKKYQKRKGIRQDGKISQTLITAFNLNDEEKFVRVAITMDKYKQLPAMPKQYVWVNIPNYYLQLHDSDSVVLTSKVVVGKPTTKTPQLTSAISDMITYPKWTIPESIIEKEVLPALKRDPGYLKRKGFSLVDDNSDEEVDPYKIKWAKYSKTIPYKVVQGSGDDNALGVLKFNFPNKYAVYLHDTNQRYLFGKTVRSLSHGCVRVQSWQQLAFYLLRNDSIASPKAVPIDSLTNWLSQKQRHYIPLHKRIPVYIRYFTCEAKANRLVFFDDIYGEDQRLKEKYFADK
jgi:murein L,D-transpeptidase YcbB/YkuD